MVGERTQNRASPDSAVKQISPQAQPGLPVRQQVSEVMRLSSQAKEATAAGDYEKVMLQHAIKIQKPLQAVHLDSLLYVEKRAGGGRPLEYRLQGVCP